MLAGEDPRSVAASGKKTKLRLLRCLQQGCFACLRANSPYEVDERCAVVTSSRHGSNAGAGQSAASRPTACLRPTTAHTCARHRGRCTSQRLLCFRCHCRRCDCAAVCAVRRVKDSVCNILDIGEHTAIGENLGSTTAHFPLL